MLELATLQDFDGIYNLLEESFPPSERRSYSGQRALLDNARYRIYLSRDQEKDKIRGFLATYEFDEFCFIEHFAVDKAYRNQGLGADMVRSFSEKSQKLVCLEVEPPESELARRRVAFYQRNGFFLHDFPYTQPPIETGKPPIPLRLMTTDGALSYSELEKIKTILFREVYGQK